MKSKKIAEEPKIIIESVVTEDGEAEVAAAEADGVSVAEEMAVVQKVKAKKPAVPLHLAERYFPPLKTGLTSEQVDERKEHGLTNYTKKRHGKTYPQIFISNIFTFFNLIYAIVLVGYIYFGVADLGRMLFILPVLANTAIAIFQEVKSKMKLDKLALITAPMAEVIRDGVTFKIPVNEVVLDDLVYYGVGKQIAADGIVEDGYIEVDESMLTGEAEPVTKKKGEFIYAGSYVVSGHCTAKTEKVGGYNYIQGLTAQAKRYQKPRSQLLKTMRSILMSIAVIIVPLGVFLFINNYGYAKSADLGKLAELLTEVDVDSPLQYGVVKTAAAVVSMIPVGVFLLTSITLAMSVIKLYARQTLVQELYCVEMLARVDVLCFDKTGTITDGTMHVENLVEIKNESKHSVEQIIGSMLNALDDNNMTSVALINKFGVNKLMKKTAVIPFSSARKFSAVSFGEEGTYFLGAPEYVIPGGTPKTDAIIKKYLEKGCRVLMLGYSAGTITMPESGEAKLPGSRRSVAIIVIEDRIRPDAIETIRWFKQNGVAVKVISGDNPLAVSEIAKKVGIENAGKYISLEGMNEDQVAAASDKYTVFGRVSPEQKAILVKSLKNIGNTVAMTGDGVNDILAMKEADCSIAMAAGSDAARNVAHLVLVNNNFGSMPKVVAEGRRVVNNIQSVAALYYMKLIFIISLTIFTLIAQIPFPFDTKNVLLMELAIVGAPTAALALQPNTSIIRGSFFGNVMRRAVPFALVFIVQTAIIYLLQLNGSNGEPFVPMDSINTTIAYCYIITGFSALYFCCKPLNAFRGIILGSVAVVLAVGFIVTPLREFMGLKGINTAEKLLVFGIVQLSLTLMTVFVKISESLRLRV